VPETALVEMARTRPTDERVVRAIPGMTPRVMEQAGEAILQVLRGG
jgi:hypothetical protein